MEYIDVRKNIIKILNFLYMGKEPKKSDGILGLGSIDYKVAEECARLYKKGYGDYIIFSGNCGKETKGIITQTEAENFRDVAIKNGVPSNKIFLEKESRSTYENYLFSDYTIKENKLKADSLIVVQKPYAERRSYAISKKCYSNRTVYITSPKFNINNFEQYYNELGVDINGILNEIVAEVNIAQVAPSADLQIYQEIPEEVQNAYELLLKNGYTKYLLTDKRVQELKEIMTNYKSNG